MLQTALTIAKGGAIPAGRARTLEVVVLEAVAAPVGEADEVLRAVAGVLGAVVQEGRGGGEGQQAVCAAGEGVGFGGVVGLVVMMAWGGEVGLFFTFPFASAGVEVDVSDGAGGLGGVVVVMEVMVVLAFVGTVGLDGLDGLEFGFLIGEVDVLRRWVGIHELRPCHICEG